MNPTEASRAFFYTPGRRWVPVESSLIVSMAKDCTVQSLLFLLMLSPLSAMEVL